MDDRFETVDSTAACLPRHFDQAAAAPEYRGECESKRRTRGEGEYRCECGVEGRTRPVTRGWEKSSGGEGKEWRGRRQSRRSFGWWR